MTAPKTIHELRLCEACAADLERARVSSDPGNISATHCPHRAVVAIWNADVLLVREAHSVAEAKAFLQLTVTAHTFQQLLAQSAALRARGDAPSN